MSILPFIRPGISQGLRPSGGQFGFGTHTLGALGLSAAGLVNTVRGVGDNTLAALTAAGVGQGFYPSTAAQMAAAVGYGTWSAGWLFNESSGNAIGAFGGVDLVPTGSPTQALAGPRGATDLAVRLADNSTAYMSGGDNFDVGATDDFCIAWVAKHPAAPSGTRIFLSKRGVATAYWSVQMASGAGGGITGAFTDAVTPIVPGTASSATHIADTWYVGMMVLERGVGARLATNYATGTSTADTLLGSCGNATNFAGPGRSGSVVAPVDMAALWVGVGTGIAAGMNANIATAVTNLKTYIGL